MRVAEELHKAEVILKDSGVESAAVNAQWLMAHVLGCNRPELGFRQGSTLTAEQKSQWNQLVAERARRIPLQHLIGSVEFCGFELVVNKHVLVPRPETEILAEEACKFAKMRESPVILDIGTGSGCLAIAIAAQSPKGAVHALDISQEALKLAQGNANRNGLSERIIFHETDMREGCPIEEALDLIVSNPPYIPTAEIDTLQEEVREHDPRLALDGGEDGLDYYHSLTINYLRHLKPQGRLMFEVGDGQVQKVSDLIIKYGGYVLDIVSDLNNVERIVVASPGNS